MRYFIHIVLSCFLIACGSETQKQEVISLEEFAGDVGEELVEIGEFDEVQVIPTGIIDKLVFAQLNSYDTVNHTVFNPMDRFGFNERKKIEFIQRKEQNLPEKKSPKATFFYYSFSDSTKTKNAFYNWLDNLQTDETAIKLNEDIEELQIDPIFSLVYDTLIVVVNFNCEDKSHNWKPFKDTLMSHLGRKHLYQMDASCDGPLRWK